MLDLYPIGQPRRYLADYEHEAKPVVPQFLNLAQAPAPQCLIIGATLALTDLVVMGYYTVLAAKVLRALKSESHLRTMNRLFCGMFVVVGNFVDAVQTGGLRTLRKKTGLPG